MEIAIDFAIQCSPDHPWVKEHPEWFDRRPDGTIKYAENPPKKYEDIVNVHFYRGARRSSGTSSAISCCSGSTGSADLPGGQPPHQAPPFWEWMIREVQDCYPDALFLAEAFTKPKMMKRLAKVGFTQSYSYFTWRNFKQEITDYLAELTMLEPKEYLRGNLFANTPDINPPILQTGGPPAFKMRAVLAATLSKRLRPLQWLRAVRGHADTGPGRVPEFREVRDQGVGLGSAGQYPGLHHAAQQDPGGQPRSG